MRLYDVPTENLESLADHLTSQEYRDFMIPDETPEPVDIIIDVRRELKTRKNNESEVYDRFR